MLLFKKTQKRILYLSIIKQDIISIVITVGTILFIAVKMFIFFLIVRHNMLILEVLFCSREGLTY